MKKLLEQIKNGESQTIEFKISFQKEVIASIFAFANAKGDFRNNINEKCEYEREPISRIVQRTRKKLDKVLIGIYNDVMERVYG